MLQYVFIYFKLILKHMFQTYEKENLRNYLKWKETLIFVSHLNISQNTRKILSRQDIEYYIRLFNEFQIEFPSLDQCSEKTISK